MRKLTALFLALALSLCLASALADRTVTVTGSGETLVTADTAVVSLGVNVRMPDALQAQSGANEAVARIRAALTGAGFSEEDISTGYINLYAIYNYSEDVEVIDPEKETPSRVFAPAPKARSMTSPTRAMSVTLTARVEEALYAAITSTSSL